MVFLQKENKLKKKQDVFLEKRKKRLQERENKLVMN